MGSFCSAVSDSRIRAHHVLLLDPERCSHTHAPKLVSTRAGEGRSAHLRPCSVVHEAFALLEASLPPTALAAAASATTSAVVNTILVSCSAPLPWSCYSLRRCPQCGEHPRSARLGFCKTAVLQLHPARSSRGRRPTSRSRSRPPSAARSRTSPACRGSPPPATETISPPPRLQPKWRSIISAERMSEPGLTLSWPAYFGAVPCVASKNATSSEMFAAGRDADAADLRGERVRDVVAVQVRRRDHVVLARAQEDLLQERVRDHVLDHDGRRPSASTGRRRAARHRTRAARASSPSRGTRPR